MHDIDRTQNELEQEHDEFETDEFELEDAYELDGEFDGEADSETDGETDGELYGELDSEDLESPFNEVDETELAEELLSVGNEQEVDHFFGKVFRRAAGRGRGRRRGRHRRGAPRRMRALGGFAKRFARKALPKIAAFAGGPIGGAILGSATDALMGRLLGELQQEHVDSEDQEFEMARRVVRVAGSAANRAMSIDPRLDPVTAAKRAMVGAMRRQVASRRSRGGAHTRSGRWIRRGRKIVLLGV
jgi:hypothetical protein